jgi:hypothetical protein
VRSLSNTPATASGSASGSVSGPASPPGAYAAATKAIDDANAADPNLIDIGGALRPLALVHGQLAARWIERLVPEPGDSLRLAARAHHLRRWELARTAYPEGRAGYLRWRKDQKARHAAGVAALLTTAGYGDEVIERVQALIRRDRLAVDPGAQAVEDAACLVFVETQLAAMVPRLAHDHLVEVIRKTARKMSPAALAAVSTIALGDVELALLTEALAP